MTHNQSDVSLKDRFRGFLPVIVDVETGGFNAKTDALLELAAVTVMFDEQGQLQPHESYHYHIIPFEGANMEQSALDFIGIDPYHPFRLAVPEHEALDTLFKGLRKQVKHNECQRAVLVGHNAAFDLSFLQAAMRRCKFKRSPFHHFTTFDTATLSAIAYGQTVLAKALKAADIDYDAEQAHTAIYDAKQTALLFCNIVNQWPMI